MYHNDDNDELELEAIRLIDQAEELIDKGKGEEAINLYEKAAQIYLDRGSYIKIDELFARIIEIISQFKNNIQAIYRLRSIIRKTEELKLDEITAKLLIQLGNIASKMNDWETAGESYAKASDYLYETDPEEYYNLSAILLLKAGQLFERSPTKKDEGKRLILKAVMKINKFDELYELEEKRAEYLLATEQFRFAADKFLEIANYFKKALKSLDEILSEEETADTTRYNAQARFIHFVAEYQTVAALCLEASKNEEYKEEIAKIAEDSIDLFKKSISLLKKYMLKKKRIEFDNEVILRVCFDTMLLSILLDLLNKKDISPIEFLLKDLEVKRKVITKLQETPYFKIAERIQKLGTQDVLEELKKVNLGHFEKIKNLLISYFS
ncbi:MAG: hypothetical protein ACP6IY_01795 [Promethearchaeia archaeon]